MTEVKAKVRALVASGMEPDMVVELIIDVVARGLGRLGGRPRNGSSRSNDVPNESGGNAPTSVDAEVTKPVCAVAEPVSAKGGKGGDPGSSLQLFSGSPPDASLESSSDRRSDGPAFPPDFAAFLAAYPAHKRKNKADALRAWKRNRPPLVKVLAALAWQVRSHDWTKDGGKWVPLPASYINAGGWMDEQGAPPRPAVHPKDQAAYDLVKEGFPGK